MKKIALIPALLMGIYAGLSASDELSREKIQEIQNKYSEVLGGNGISVVKGIDRNGFYQLLVEANTGNGIQRFETFVVNGIDAIFAGNAYTTKGDRIFFPANVDVIKKAVSMKLGTGSKQLYLVTDPQCPYCQNLDRQITDEALKEYTVNIIFMPLSFHKDAVPMIQWVFDAGNEKDQLKRLKLVMSGDQSYKKFSPSPTLISKVNHIVELGYKAAEELQAQGTPSLYDENMQPINQGVLIK